MIFFDEKEDVIDLQLTQYGKYLLSQGNFKPIYYAFYDDDIIYDQRYTSGSALETQNNIEDRIFDETPRTKTQYLFHSVDQLEELNVLQRTNFTEYKEKIQQTPEKHFTAAAPLGNSYLLGDKAPAFNIRFAVGSISGSTTTISGAGDQIYSTQRIPQIDLEDVTFYISVKRSDENIIPDEEGSNNFEDGTYLDVKEDYLLLTIKEENVPLTKDNFDIEVYTTDQSGNIDFPLYFSEKKATVKNGILLDPPDLSSSPPIDTDQVEYFFDLWADGDISFNMASLLDREE